LPIYARSKVAAHIAATRGQRRVRSAAISIAPAARRRTHRKISRNGPATAMNDTHGAIFVALPFTCVDVTDSGITVVLASSCHCLPRASHCKQRPACYTLPVSDKSLADSAGAMLQRALAL